MRSRVPASLVPHEVLLVSPPPPKHVPLHHPLTHAQQQAHEHRHDDHQHHGHERRRHHVIVFVLAVQRDVPVARGVAVVLHVEHAEDVGTRALQIPGGD